MNAKQLIEQLKKCDENKVVVLTEPDAIGWTNIGYVVEESSTIKIVMDDNSRDK